MKKYLNMLLIIVFVVSMMFVGISCKEDTVEEAVEGAAEEVVEEEAIETEEAVEEKVVQEEKEEYVWIASLSNLPLFLTHDYVACRQFAEYLGVNITFAGPTTVDVAAENAALEQAIARGVDGVMFMPFGEGHNATIDKTIDAGIPLVCFDGDAPNSKRIAFIGDGWRNMGIKQAKILAEQIGGKGQVMIQAIIPNDNTELAVGGFMDTMEQQFPDIEILGLDNNDGDIATSANLAAKTLQVYPDIAGFYALNLAAGPGIALAVQEAGKVGEVVIVAGSDPPEILQLIKEGVIYSTLAQQREAFNVFALKILYSVNHPEYELATLFKEKAGIDMVPLLVYTDTTLVTKDNIETYEEINEYLTTLVE